VTEPISDLQGRRGDEAAHASAARNMFDRIAPTYDLLNRLMSVGIDRRWRARAITEVARAPAGPMLDLCAGTMELTAMLAEARPADRIVAVDFSPAMLDAGRRKAPRAEVVVADAAKLPFGDGLFSGVICGFGMRNLADPVAGAREAYARVFLPALGGWVSGDRRAYEYLARSMAGFFTRQEYERALTTAGFGSVRGFDLTLGIASIVRAEVLS
jgi:ubiquinone/menaquinone biosynthesis C-methylase UbiE